MQRFFFILAFVSTSAFAGYPLQPSSVCGAGFTCADVLARWNAASWDALVDDQVQAGGATTLATVRKYDTEGACTGYKCDDQLTRFDTRAVDAAQHRFFGVTDELSNVLLSHALGDNQPRFTALRNFVELLRDPRINNLQCWRYYVAGQQTYTGPQDVCVADGDNPPVDSAADASLRILGAYGIACAKQRAGVWTGGPDFCADYVRQGTAIVGGALHGELAILPNGRYFLANGFRIQPFAPTAGQSFRPDYYELAFLLDYALYRGDARLIDGVSDLLRIYSASTGSNHVHRGKTGHFDGTGTAYTCDDLCAPPYLDNIDTWRAVPALSTLLALHPDYVSADLRATIFDAWWTTYGGSAYPVSQPKPSEIYSNASDGGVKTTEFSYKTFSMWIPLAVAYDAAYARSSIALLVQNYDWTSQHFFGAAYYGGYFSQFAQRAIGVATGLLDPSTYTTGAPPPPPRRRVVRH
jgi:hypothetical protein